MNAKDTITQAARDILDAARNIHEDVGAGAGWRALRDGETFAEGDEVLNNRGQWQPTMFGPPTKLCVKDNPNSYRRRVDTAGCLLTDLVCARVALVHYKAQCTKLEDDLKAKGDEMVSRQKAFDNQVNATLYWQKQYTDEQKLLQVAEAKLAQANEEIRRAILQNSCLQTHAARAEADLKEEKFQHNVLKACAKAGLLLGCNAARKEPTTGWRLLDPEEILQHGDEYTVEIVGLWSGLGAHWIGVKASAFNNRGAPSKVRRKITASEENGYRTLARSETTREGDEFISPLWEVDEWTKATVGITIADNFTEHATVRRKIVRL